MKCQKHCKYQQTCDHAIHSSQRAPYFTEVSEHALTWNAKNTVKYQQTCDHASDSSQRAPYFTRVSEHALTWNAKNIVKYQQTCDHAIHYSQRAPYFTRFSGARMQFYDAFLMKTQCFIAFFARRIFSVKNRGLGDRAFLDGPPPFFP